jgi:hypothetical protein
MRVRSMIITQGLFLFLLCGLSGPASAQQQQGKNDSDLKLSFNATPVLQLDAKLEGGSEFSVSRYIFSAEITKRIAESTDVGLSLLYDHEDFDFSGVTRFAGPSPWNEVNRVGAGVSYSRRLGQGWRLFISPSAEYARESGADWSTALIYGGVVSAGKRISDDLTIGMGAGVFYRLEETRVFPLLTVSWNISEQWRLANPLRTGPTGPAGLELIYAAATGWDLGFGSAYRSTRFRLDDQGVAPRGVGEVRGAPTWVRLSRSLGPDIKANLYGGTVFGGKLSIENERGGSLGAESFGPAPFAALTVTARF